jgi:hypothetical protein
MPVTGSSRSWDRWLEDREADQAKRDQQREHAESDSFAAGEMEQHVQKGQIP